MKKLFMILVSSTFLFGILGSCDLLQELLGNDEYAITITTIGSGSVTKNPEAAIYAKGSTVLLTAAPVRGWSFSNWSGDATGSENPLTVVMDATKVIIAVFTENFSLTVTTTGSGSVSKAPDQATYMPGSTVDLMATPASEWSFSSWSGDATGSENPLTIVMDAE